MGDYAMADLANVIKGSETYASKVAKNSTSAKAGKGLEMDDFLMLMVATLQNQSIDETADTSDMLNQMVQMSVITAINNISSLVSESTSLTYAASLVGKEVTIGVFEGNSIKEIVGVVTGTGTLNGQQVIFIGDDIYYLSQVMAIGRLPASDEEKAEAGNGSDTTPPEGADEYVEVDADGDGEMEKVYAGEDGVFGTADDYYNKDVNGHSLLDKVYAGEDKVFGSADDYYDKVVDGKVIRVYAGPDGEFGTDDDDEQELEAVDSDKEPQDEE